VTTNNEWPEKEHGAWPSATYPFHCKELLHVTRVVGLVAGPPTEMPTLVTEEIQTVRCVKSIGHAPPHISHIYGQSEDHWVNRSLPADWSHMRTDPGKRQGIGDMPLP